MTSETDTIPEISFEQIRERAFDLWERHHRPDGFEVEFWVMAEQELKAERERRLRRGDPAQVPQKVR